MAQTSGAYVYGSAARKLEYDVYEENKVLRDKKKARSNVKIKFRLVLNILFVFAGCLLLMYRFALITDLNYRIADAYSQYNELRNENSRLSVEIGKDMSLSKVKEVAESRLGMQKPDKYQVVHIMVPRTDYTVVAEGYATAAKKPEGSLAALFDRVKKYAQLLY